MLKLLFLLMLCVFVLFCYVWVFSWSYTVCTLCCEVQPLSLISTNENSTIQSLCVDRRYYWMSGKTRGNLEFRYLFRINDWFNIKCPCSLNTISASLTPGSFWCYSPITLQPWSAGDSSLLFFSPLSFQISFYHYVPRISCSSPSSE